MAYRDDRMQRYLEARALSELNTNHGYYRLAGLIGAILTSIAVMVTCYIIIPPL